MPPLAASAQFDRMKKLFRFGLKFQMTNNKQIPMTEIQNSKHTTVWVIGY
jgi:hypothetical protein